LGETVTTQISRATFKGIEFGENKEKPSTGGQMTNIGYSDTAQIVLSAAIIL